MLMSEDAATLCASTSNSPLCTDHEVVRGGERLGFETGRTGAMLALLACCEGNRTAVSTSEASSRGGSLSTLRDMSPSGLHIVVSKVVEQRGPAALAAS